MTQGKLLGKEKLWAEMERKDFKEILEVKKGWQKAKGSLKDIFEEENFRIRYQGNIWHGDDIPVNLSIHRKEVHFSTPNREVWFDYFPSQASKQGIIAHELSHLYEYRQHGDKALASKSWDGVNPIEIEERTCPEQRANLISASFIPNKLHESYKEELKSHLRLLGEDFEGLGRYKTPLVLNEFLGRLGLKRSDDVPELFKEIKENTNFEITKLLDRFPLLCLAGLATPYERIEDKSYGVRTFWKLKLIQRRLSREIKGEPYYGGIITQEVRPGVNINLNINLPDWNLEKGRENLEKALSHWEIYSRHHNTYHAPEDLRKGLLKLKDNLESVLR